MSNSSKGMIDFIVNGVRVPLVSSHCTKNFCRELESVEY